MKFRYLIPLSNKGLPVVRNYFDAFLYSFIAADHLLCGITKGLIEVFICNWQKPDH